MIGQPYKYRSRRAATWRDWGLLIVAGVLIGCTFTLYI